MSSVHGATVACGEARKRRRMQCSNVQMRALPAHVLIYQDKFGGDAHGLPCKHCYKRKRRPSVTREWIATERSAQWQTQSRPVLQPSMQGASLPGWGRRNKQLLDLQPHIRHADLEARFGGIVVMLRDSCDLLLCVSSACGGSCKVG